MSTPMQRQQIYPYVVESLREVGGVDQWVIFDEAPSVEEAIRIRDIWIEQDERCRVKAPAEIDGAVAAVLLGDLCEIWQAQHGGAEVPGTYISLEPGSHEDRRIIAGLHMLAQTLAAQTPEDDE